MARHSLNPRLIKINRNYTVEEAARCLKVHKNTVRNWLRQGLDAIADRKPILILGCVLREFLETRRAKAKRACPPGHFYCLHCRAPQPPAGQMADYIPDTSTSGNLRSLCSSCDGWMCQRASLAKIDALRANLDIKTQPAHRRLGESVRPRVNCDL